MRHRKLKSARSSRAHGLRRHNRRARRRESRLEAWSKALATLASYSPATSSASGCAD